MPTVRLPEVELYYERHGDGPPLLLINGLGASLEMWSRFWRQLAACHEVILFDNRGVGRSSIPTEPYTIEAMAEDTAGLLDALNLPEAAVYGAAMGGQVALELALRHPTRVRALLLGMTSCGGPKSVPTPPEVRKHMMNALRPPPGMPLSVAREMWWRLLYSPEFVVAHREELTREAEAVRYPTTPMGYQRQAEASLTFDAYDRLPRIHAPTLVMAGGRDVIVPPQNARILADRIPEAQLHVFEGVGHGFTREREAEAVNEMIDFLWPLEVHPSPYGLAEMA